jgi:hypothetical protein
MTHSEPPDAREAAAQLGMVQTILERAGRSQRPTPFTYVSWGLASAAFNLVYVPALAPFQVALYNASEVLTVIAYVLTVVEFVRTRRNRATVMDRQALAVFAGVTTVLWTLKWIWFTNGLVGGVPFAFMWSLGFAFALVVHGIGPLRPLLVGGLIMVAGVFVASILPAHIALVLALGNLFGLAGPGTYFLLRRA